MRALPLAAFLAAALPLAPAFSAEVDFPARKAGQWELSMTVLAGRPATVTQMCLDATTDHDMMAAGLSSGSGTCTKRDITRDGASIVIDATCQMGAMHVDSHTVIAGDFQSAYTVTITSKMTGGTAAAAGTHVITQQARWVSATCSNGLKPGEITMPNGAKVNLLATLKKLPQ